MPFPAITGQRIPLNLGARWTASSVRLPLNLGVDGSGPPDPPDPPDPTVDGDTTFGTRMRWGHGVPVSRPLSTRWGGLQAVSRATAVSWGGFAAIHRALFSPWSTPAIASANTRSRWGRGQPNVQHAMQLRWSAPPSVFSDVRVPWQTSMPSLGREIRSSWLSPPKHHRSALLAWYGVGPQCFRSTRIRWLAPGVVFRYFDIPWGYGQGLEWIVRPPKPPVDPPTESPVDGRYVGLNLACPVYAGPTNRLPLNLGSNACYLARSQQRTYVVLNEISVVRLPDRLPIHVDGGSVGSGRDAWCWDARLSLADPAQLAALQPTIDGPRKLEVTVNGYAFVVAVEAFDENKIFGSIDITVSGRSVTVQLSDPYAAARTQETTLARTMVQLADAEIAGTDIAVDYGTVDWLVPAGAWYYDGLTPMAALNRIAAASGAVVQSHRTDAIVSIAPRYPVSPWLWTTTTPDVVIQDDIIDTQRLQLQSKPMYDAVIAAGERIGVAANVTREGEAGDTYAPQQIDQLITHADGARERGRNVLSDRGGQASIEHDLPLFGGALQPGQPGLVLPLMLAERVTAAGTWHGVVTAVRINFQRQDKAIDVVQTVTIERHYADAD